MQKTSRLPKRFLPLDSPDATLQEVGGKALNLIKLTRAGFRVPAGFIIPTGLYRQFITINSLDKLLQDILAASESLSPQAAGEFSQQLRTGFLAGDLPAGLAAELKQAKLWLGADSTAVRSSATAEDLPQASFAGQQATFLNVTNHQSLLESVIQCWASLWTQRAISYRQQNQIDHRSVELAVVVQAMVPSQASGVMFTANPLSGLRTEVHIDATLGLGEALVSGQVEPDHYVIDKTSGQLLQKVIGAKDTRTMFDSSGGVEARTTDASGAQALLDEHIQKLAEIGLEIEQLFDFPQDVEWAYLPSAEAQAGAQPLADPSLFILQSRPITSLYPLPQETSPDPLQVYFSFGAVQGLTDPMTPLGQDAIRLIFAGAGSLFGIKADQHSQGVITIAGERLWGRFTSIIRHPLGARLIPRIFGMIEPGSVASLHEILKDDKVAAASGRLRPITLWRVGRFLLRMIGRVLPLALRPEGKAEDVRRAYQARLLELEQHPANQADQATLAEVLDLFMQIRQAFPFAVPEIASPVLAGLLPLLPLSYFAKRWTGSADMAMEITRGLENNVTTEMDLSLWQTAQSIKVDEDSRNHFKAMTSQQLSQDYLKRRLPAPAQQALDNFLQRYGMRGLAEIDIGRPRWRQDPTPIMQALQSYLLIDDGPAAPDRVFQRSRQTAMQAIQQLETAASGTRFGSIKARLIRALAKRVRAFAGLRESPKFYIVQMMEIIREQLLEVGGRLASQGVTGQAEDLFFLYLDELEALDRGDALDWIELIARRRQDYQRETRRRQIPRLLLSDGRAYYQGVLPTSEGQGQLHGSPVSPGTATGQAGVVLDPLKANLQPGQIMVCPGTDPSWTPLFLVAGGLIMELGGMMTHGAIVAREYGIPAVVGVDRATERIKPGDRLRIDGSRGVIDLLDDPPAI